MDLADLIATMPFAVAVGITIDAASKDGVRGRVPWSPRDANDKLVALVTQTQAVLAG